MRRYHHMTIIVGKPAEHNCRRKGIAILPLRLKACRSCFTKSWRLRAAVQRSAINVVDEQPEGDDIDPHFTLFTTSQCLNEPELHASTSRLQRFSHKYALAVLIPMPVAVARCGMKAGNFLVVRADCVRYYRDGSMHNGGLARRYHSITLRSFR